MTAAIVAVAVAVAVVTLMMVVVVAAATSSPWQWQWQRRAPLRTTKQDYDFYENIMRKYFITRTRVHGDIKPCIQFRNEAMGREASTPAPASQSAPELNRVVNERICCCLYILSMFAPLASECCIYYYYYYECRPFH